MEVIVQDIYTESIWLQKIGDGPWKKIDLSVYGGKVPVVLGSKTSWSMTETLYGRQHYWVGNDDPPLEGC